MKLLLRKEGYSAFNPVFSPDGSKIFYLLADIGNSVKNGGHLRVINIEGSVDRLLLDGIFGSLAISPDGEKLILTTGDIFYDTSSIIIVDTSGVMVDTLQIEVSIKDVEFGKDINEIYYFRNGLGFYKYSFIDSSENLVLELNESFDELQGFDIKDDSLLFFKGILYFLAGDSSKNFLQIFWSKFSPQSSKLLVGTTSWAFYTTGDLYLLRIDTNTHEELKAIPYSHSTIVQPDWSPCGEKIVFAANDQTGRASSTGFELWILEKIE
ncbi:MAG: hypothetical protein OEZ20_03405 [candidate division WOR-3 bacterium]|nr:hypothetical protein [candidate division WOR-3 bacterium]